MDNQEQIVLYQGIHGAYSDMAAFEFFSRYYNNVKAKLKGKKSLSLIVDLLIRDKSLAAFLPVENSTYGDVTDVWTFLLENPLRIMGEYYYSVHHCLLANKGTRLEDIKEVRSHYQALGQCSRFLEELQPKRDVKITQWYDTAGAAKDIKKEDATNVGAIASKLAAEIYGLDILAEGIENNKKNKTRFLYIRKGKYDEELQESDNLKITMIVDLDAPKPGTLIQFLQSVQMKKNDYPIRLSKIVSRPIPTRPFEYHFIIELEGIKDIERVNYLISEGKKNSINISILGVYKKGFISL